MSYSYWSQISSTALTIPGNDSKSLDQENYYNEQIEQVSNYCKSQGKRFFKFN